MYGKTIVAKFVFFTASVAFMCCRIDNVHGTNARLDPVSPRQRPPELLMEKRHLVGLTKFCSACFGRTLLPIPFPFPVSFFRLVRWWKRSECCREMQAGEGPFETVDTLKLWLVYFGVPASFIVVRQLLMKRA